MKRPVFQQIVVLMLICVASQAQAAGRNHDPLDEGRSAIRLHDFAKAIQVLQAGLKSNPGNLEMKNELGKAYLYSQDDVHARAMFEEVLSTAPQDRTANLEMARLLGYRHQYNASNLRYRQMLASNPKDVPAATGLVRNLIHQKRYDEARTELRAALKRNPQDAKLKNLEAKLRTNRAEAQGLEKEPARVRATEFFFSDSAGDRVLRSDQTAEYSFSPVVSTRLQLEEKRLWQNAGPRSNMFWFSDEVKVRPTSSLAFMAGGGAVRFPDSSSRSLYRGQVELMPFRHVYVTGGFGRSAFAPTVQASLLNLTSEGWFSRVQGAPGPWRFTGGWSHQHLTDGNRSTREDLELIRWFGGTRFSVAAGYRYDHAHFSQVLSHGYFSPNRYHSNLGITGIKFRPTRYWLAEYLVKTGEEQIETNALRPAYEVSLHNRVLIRQWELDGTYSYYHIAQTAGAFTAHGVRIGVARRF